jgi:hypothetical protein
MKYMKYGGKPSKYLRKIFSRFSSDSLSVTNANWSENKSGSHLMVRTLGMEVALLANFRV